MSVVLVAAGAGVLAAPAAAKWMLEVERPTTLLRVGDSWRAEIRVVGAHLTNLSGPPVVRIRHVESGRSLLQRAQRVPGQRRIYETRIRFPQAGKWRYVVRHQGAVFRYRPLVVAKAPPPSRDSAVRSASLGIASREDESGLVPIVAGLGSASLLLAAALAGRRRSRRAG